MRWEVCHARSASARRSAGARGRAAHSNRRNRISQTATQSSARASTPALRYSLPFRCQPRAACRSPFRNEREQGQAANAILVTTFALVLRAQQPELLLATRTARWRLARFDSLSCNELGRDSRDAFPPTPLSLHPFTLKLRWQTLHCTTTIGDHSNHSLRPILDRFDPADFSTSFSPQRKWQSSYGSNKSPLEYRVVTGANREAQ